MSKPSSQSVERRATRWFIRLSRPKVSLRAARSFHQWRKNPRNAEAYGRVEDAWRRVGPLDGDPAIRAAIHDALSRRTLKVERPDISRRLVLGTALGAAGVGAAVLIFWPQGQLYQSQVGELRSVALEDGGRVRLDTDTRLTIHYTADERAVTLHQGQARFTVTPDRRPFTVVAGATTVRALGTEFDVRLLADGARVALLEGAVEVQSRRAPTERLSLRPGDVVETRTDGPLKHMTAQDEPSWAQGRVVFRQTPLREAVQELNRYRQRPLLIEESALAAAPVSGVFETSDTQAFIDAAAEIWGLRVVSEDDDGVRLGRQTN